MISSFAPHPLLRLDGVSKSFVTGGAAVRALDDVSFSLDTGEVVALVGRSGSGKTTLLNIVLGWEAADRGSILWDGRPDDRLQLPWDVIGVLPQSSALIEELSVLDNVRLPLTLVREPGDESRRLPDVIARLGIEHLSSRRPGEISMGEQQRTALARAVILSPRLLVADEPTSHQDLQHAEDIFRLFRELAREGMSCLLATHSEDAVRFCDRVVMLEGGRVEFSRGGGIARE